METRKLTIQQIAKDWLYRQIVLAHGVDILAEYKGVCPMALRAEFDRVGWPTDDEPMPK